MIFVNSGAVIVAGMIEKGMFYSEYEAMNEEGSTVRGFIEVTDCYWNLNPNYFQCTLFKSHSFGYIDC